MNIPFYRYVKYLDDGHELYQCLQCGEKIDVGLPYCSFSPRFCCYCGVEYQGAILPKKIAYISSNSKTTELYFQVESAYDWGDGVELHWNVSWRGSNSPQKVIKYLRDEKAEKAKEQRYSDRGWKFRITVSKKDISCGYININVDDYYRRTGKKFDRKLYEKVVK